MDDPYDLERFVTAQNEAGTFDRAVEELRRGSKRGHWMWFVFPQIAGLGFSAGARSVLRGGRGPGYRPPTLTRRPGTKVVD